jgi:hypothetical protein
MIDLVRFLARMAAERDHKAQSGTGAPTTDK